MSSQGLYRAILAVEQGAVSSVGHLDPFTTGNGYRKSERIVIIEVNIHVPIDLRVTLSYIICRKNILLSLHYVSKGRRYQVSWKLFH